MGKNDNCHLSSQTIFSPIVKIIGTYLLVLMSFYVFLQHSIDSDAMMDVNNNQVADKLT